MIFSFFSLHLKIKTRII